MIISPKIRGFICTTTHPVGCDFNVKEQINLTQKLAQFSTKGENIAPKRVLVIGSSSGYGLSSRIAAAFGAQAATIGVFFEKPGTDRKPGTAGWYNSAAFDKYAKEAGLYSKSFNGDAFSDQAKEKVIEAIKADLGQIDLVVYSLASPVRKHPKTGEVIRSALKPIGTPYVTTAVDTNKDLIIEATVEPATPEEIQDTVKVMGGEDWEMWIDALLDADLLSNHCKTISYSYIGSEITWPIYWHGTLGKAKEDLDRAAKSIRSKLASMGGSANVAVLKSVVTQASSAIPVMPLYLSMVFKRMKSLNIHEGCMEQILRLFNDCLYRKDQCMGDLDRENRFRVDDWELRDDVQNYCRDLWSQVTSENINELTDYQYYKDEFLRLFGFNVPGVDYNEEVNPESHFDVVDINVE